MNEYLLIDFGATRIKTAIVEIESGILTQIKDYSCPPNCSKIKGQYEISLKALKDVFLSICDYYYNHLRVHFKGIMLCSQMHGFALLSKDNRPLSEYISWKDERSLSKINGQDTFTIISKELGMNYKKTTGMKPRPGLPFMNAVHYVREIPIKPICKIITLPEWLSLCSDDSNNLVHDTMMAGMGFYDLFKKKVSEELLNLAKELSGTEFIFNDLGSVDEIAGYWHNGSKRIPIYVGVGDHQSAILGAGNKPKISISINIGTGSQVSRIDEKITQEDVELRPYFDSSVLATITHIPAGRALNEYIMFLEDICQNCTGKVINFWDWLKNINEDDILNSTLNFDLAIFKSAWNYTDGGKIMAIFERELTLRNYLASLLRCLIEQYLEAVKKMGPQEQIQMYILSGGVPRRLPVLVKIFATLIKHKTLGPTVIDETLIGLRSLALFAEKQTKKMS